MATWATKRKLSYLSIVGGVLFVLVVIPLFMILYEKPTCFDNKRNGDELGIDCGGSCVRLCSFEALAPVVLWSRVFRVTDDMYSAVAYIENPNVTSSAESVPYTFKLYDENNVLITEREGVTYVPRNKRFAIFEGKIQIGDRKPRSVKFEFTSEPTWKKSTAEEPEIEVQSRALSREETSPRVVADLFNKTLDTVSDIEVTAIVYDGNNNAVGVSRTFVDALKKGESAQAVFTWPEPFQAELDVCEVPTDVMLVVDRSGSMASDGTNPPEPLTDAKNAADAFIGELTETDQIGLVSFATNASDPIDATLSNNHAAVKAIVDSLSIRTDGPQNTNIGGGLLAAMNEVTSPRHNPGSKQVIVALTDGIATDPEKPGDENYPQTYAAAIAEEAKAKDIQLYMVGLGKEVSAAYLQSLASAHDHYYGAGTGKDLAGIYTEIATKICKKRPAVVEIISRIPPQS